MARTASPRSRTSARARPRRSGRAPPPRRATRSGSRAPPEARRATRRDTETARRRCRRRRAAGSSTRWKPLPSGPSTRDLVAGPRRAERARARADRVDEEAELALGREAERHRPRQQPSRRLEHEELPGDARVERRRARAEAACTARPPRCRGRLSRCALQLRSAPGARARPRCARSRSRARPRRRRQRRDARHAVDERGLADQVAVRSGAVALRRVDHEVAAAAADEVDDRRAAAVLDHLAHALDRRARPPRASRRFPRSRRARSRGPPSAAATGTSAGLSASRTERKTVPLVGSRRPAARSAFANAVGRSAALAITSPVARISGPEHGIAAREAVERQHGGLDAHLRGRPLRRQLERAELLAEREPARGAHEVHAGRLRRERHRARRARVRLEHEDLAVRDRELHVQQADDAEPAARSRARCRRSRSPATR